MSKYKLSICMMVKNEEKNIRNCLESLKELLTEEFAELIIVDTGSEDSTYSICNEYTEKLYYHKWNNDFSAMRNITISYATGEWIFIIDGDEVLEESEKLKRILLKKSTDKCNTLIINCKNLRDYTGNNYTMIPTPRLFRNDGNFKYDGIVHNQPKFYQPVQKYEVMLVHYGYIIQDRELMEKKYVRTKGLLEKALENRPNDIYYLYQLAMSYGMYGKTRESCEYIEKAMNEFKKIAAPDIDTYTYVIVAFINSCNILNKFDEGIKAINNYGEYLNELPQFNYNSAGLYASVDIEKAKDYFEKYLKSIKNLKKSKYSSDARITLYAVDDISQDTAYIYLAEYYLKKHKLEKALEFAEKIKCNEELKKNLVVKILIREDEDKLYAYISNNHIENIENIIEDYLQQVESHRVNRIREKLVQLNNLYGRINSAILDDNYEIEDLKLILDNSKCDYMNRATINVLTKMNSEYILHKLKKFNRVEILKIINIIYLEKFALYKEIVSLIIKKRISNRDLGLINLAICILEFELIAEKQENINDDLMEKFRVYINLGIKFVDIIYSPKVTMYTECISDSRDRVFIYMKIALENIDINKKITIEYLRKVIQLNKGLSKYIGEYSDEILNEVEIYEE